MSLLIYFLKLVSWLLFATFCGACFWGLVGLVGMIIEPKRVRR